MYHVGWFGYKGWRISFEGAVQLVWVPERLRISLQTLELRTSQISNPKQAFGEGREQFMSNLQHSVLALSFGASARHTHCLRLRSFQGSCVLSFLVSSPGTTQWTLAILGPFFLTCHWEGRRRMTALGFLWSSNSKQEMLVTKWILLHMN